MSDGPPRTEGRSLASLPEPGAPFSMPNHKLTFLERFTLSKSDSTFNAVAGAAGGLTSGVITCPLDVIKTKLQAQGGFRIAPTRTAAATLPEQHAVYRGMLGTARVIWREEGIRGMYRGLGPIVLGYLPTWAVWFTIYGKSKEYFSPRIGTVFCHLRKLGLTWFQRTPTWSIFGRPSLQVHLRQWSPTLSGLSRHASCHKSARPRATQTHALHGSTSLRSMQQRRCIEPRASSHSTPDSHLPCWGSHMLPSNFPHTSISRRTLLVREWVCRSKGNTLPTGSVCSPQVYSARSWPAQPPIRTKSFALDFKHSNALFPLLRMNMPLFEGVSKAHIHCRSWSAKPRRLCLDTEAS